MKNHATAALLSRDGSVLSDSLEYQIRKADSLREATAGTVVSVLSGEYVRVVEIAGEPSPSWKLSTNDKDREYLAAFNKSAYPTASETVPAPDKKWMASELRALNSAGAVLHPNGYVTYVPKRVEEDKFDKMISVLSFLEKNGIDFRRTKRKVFKSLESVVSKGSDMFGKRELELVYLGEDD